MTLRHWGALVALLLGSAVLAVLLGSVALAPADVWGALRGEGSAATLAIVRDLRLPRVALAALVGAGLGVSGGALQATLRNPLAEPYLLGVSGGAATGAVVAVALGAGALVVPVAAFGGAIGAVVLALLVARAAGSGGDARVLLMAGVMIGAFANAAILLALANAPADTVRGALWWMMGSVGQATWEQVRWLALALVVAGGLLLVRARDLDVLALGTEPAAGLGVDVDRAARRVYLLSALLAAATVSAAGLVGFVGLVVPHLVRSLARGRHRDVLGAAALAGATLVVVADLAARVLRAPAELPLGAVTALAGVPFFLVQLRRLS